MEGNNCSQHYEDARKAGLRQYRKNIMTGRQGHLVSLDGIIRNADIICEEELGTIDIPLNKIVGTNSHSRSSTFAHNFMPLSGLSSEFAQKWINVCLAHMKEGIRESIKAYEYLNWYYVVEGNKRVSVLKFFNAYSIQGTVTRLVPKRDEDNIDIRIYYEYLDFYRKTKINSVWFSKEGSFKELFSYLEKFDPTDKFANNKYRYFVYSVYLPFRRTFQDEGGDKLSLTTGDAFLEYVRLFGFPESDRENMKDNIKKLMKELAYLHESYDEEISTRPEKEGKSFISSISTLIQTHKRLKVAFAYKGTLNTSGWTFSHEAGRLHVNKVLKDEIETYHMDKIPDGIDAYESLANLAKNGYDVIFATSPGFINATLKAALEYPHTRFYNCSETHSFKNVGTYFGRLYEARFLSGIIAGSLTNTHMLGYIATHPVQGVIGGINAFALGARLVNPRVKVRVEWTRKWSLDELSDELSRIFIKENVDIICHQNTPSSRRVAREYGVYTMACDIDKNKCRPVNYLASPVWNWGLFYERIIRKIINEYSNPVSSLFGGTKLSSFWWGMDSGIVDFIYSKSKVPAETVKLISFLKKMIINYEYHPFQGPVYDCNGVLRVEDREIPSKVDLIEMDWFAESVLSDMQPVDRRKLFGDTLVGKIQREEENWKNSDRI